MESELAQWQLQLGRVEMELESTPRTGDQYLALSHQRDVLSRMIRTGRATPPTPDVPHNTDILSGGTLQWSGVDVDRFPKPAILPVPGEDDDPMPSLDES